MALLLCAMLMTDPNTPAFNLADWACWIRLLHGKECGQREPVEMGDTLWPSVRVQLLQGEP